MKKTTTLLLLISVSGFITSLVLLFTEFINPIISIDLLLCTLMSTAVFFSVKVLQKNGSKLTGAALVTAVLLTGLFTCQIFIDSEYIRITWPFIISGNILLILLGINQLLIQNKNKISAISRFSFWTSGLLFLLIHLFKQSGPTYFSILFLLLLIGSLTLIIATIQSSLKLKDQ